MPDIRLQPNDGLIGIRGVETPENPADDYAASVEYVMDQQLIASTGINISSNNRISVNVNAFYEHYVFPRSDLTVLNAGDFFTQDGLSYRYTGITNTSLDGVTLGNRLVAANARIPVTDLDTAEFISTAEVDHIPGYSPNSILQLGDTIQYVYPANTFGPGAPPEDLYSILTFIGGSATVPAAGRVAQNPLRSGQTGVGLISRDWMFPPGAVTPFRPGNQYSANALVISENNLWRALRNVLRPDDATGLATPTEGADWTLAVLASRFPVWDELEAYDTGDAVTYEDALNATNIYIASSNIPAGTTGSPNLPPVSDAGVLSVLWNPLRSGFARIAAAAAPTVGDTIIPGDTLRITGGDGATVSLEGAGIARRFEVAVDNPYDPSRGVPDWNATVTYNTGDLVVQVDPGGTPSFYRSRTDNNLNNAPVESSGGSVVQDFTNWRLVDGGLVSVAHNGGSSAGVTANSTLNISQGSGITVARSGTSYTVSANGTGHSDVSDFRPGWAYHFTDLFRDTNHTGIVGTALGHTTISSSDRGDSSTLTRGVSLVVSSDPLTYDPNQIYAFVTDSTTRHIIENNNNEDYIVYFISDSAGTFLNVIAVDPLQMTAADIGDLFQTNPGERTFAATQIEIFTLTEHHATPTTITADWALENNTDDIPGNKLGALDDAKPDNKADGTALGVIEDSWLNSNILRTTNNIDDLNNVNLGTPTTGANRFIHYDTTNNEWLENEAEVNQLEDVTFTRPTDPNQDGTQQAIQWSGSDQEWQTVDVDPGDSNNLLFTETSTTATLNEYVNTAGNTQRVRTAEITGDQLILTLVDNSTIMSTINFTTSAANAGNVVTYDWDVPAAIADLTDTVTVTEDPLSLRFFTTLATTNTSEAGDFTITPTERGRNGTWTVRWNAVQQANDLGTGGGSITPTSFTASAAGLTTTDVELAMGIAWRNAGSISTQRRFTSAGAATGVVIPFLQAYTGYETSIRSTGISTANGLVLNNFTFAGATTQNGVNVSGITSLPIGGGAEFLFITTLQVLNNATLATDTWSGSFNRPAAVTGSTVTVPFNNQRNNQAAFQYPILQVNTDSTTIPTGAQFAAGMQSNLVTTRVRTLQVNGINLDNRTGSATQYIWVSYPSGNTNPTQVTFDVLDTNGVTTRSSNVFIPANNRSSTPVLVVGSGLPDSSGENYGWFRQEVPVGQRLTLINVS